MPPQIQAVVANRQPVSRAVTTDPIRRALPDTFPGKPGKERVVLINKARISLPAPRGEGVDAVDGRGR
jgi:hypothetical protein